MKKIDINELSKIIEHIAKFLPAVLDENFVPATNGTRHEVYISEHYVIRVRKKQPDILFRESKFLHYLNQPLVPNVVWEGKINGGLAMLEDRLSGVTLQNVWRSLTSEYQQYIIDDVVGFISYLRSNKRVNFYSVNKGKKYYSMQALLMDGVKEKIDMAATFYPARELVKSIRTILEEPYVRNVQPTLSHGDLIIHNLLTDKQKLTGVLDWELAGYRDPDYDIFRLMYYHECAIAYAEQGQDPSYESTYMEYLIAALKKAGIIKNDKRFEKRYLFVRAIFFLNALSWTLRTNQSERDLTELIQLWNKRGFRRRTPEPHS